MTDSHISDSAHDFHRGVQYAPGIYSWCGELHIDEEEFIRGAHGDPNSDLDRQTARRVVRKMGKHYGIDVR